VFKEHPVFIQPQNENIKIWRYMDVVKFLALLNSNALYFSRADKLGDPFEGSWPHRNIATRKMAPLDIPEPLRSKIVDSRRSLGSMSKTWPRFLALNCWHMNPHESAAMWKLYLKSDSGIAVQSTYSRLKRAIVTHEDVFIGAVRYIDYEKDAIEDDNIFIPFVHKRMSFEHEKEIRAVIARFPKSLKDQSIKEGFNVHVNMEELVEAVYLSPSSPKWISDLIKSMIGIYGYQFRVVQSNLDAEPIF
jgi:hypothetical protein